MSDTATGARLGPRLSGQLALLAASMRAGGARVGIDELLGAHRALRAVDPSDRRQAYFALRAALCSRRDDLPVFDAAFAELFTPGPQPPAGDPLEPLGEIAKLVLPHVAVPDGSGPLREAPADVLPVAWCVVELLREKDFADYTDR